MEMMRKSSEHHQAAVICLMERDRLISRRLSDSMASDVIPIG